MFRRGGATGLRRGDVSDVTDVSTGGRWPAKRLRRRAVVRVDDGDVQVLIRQLDAA